MQSNGVEVRIQGKSLYGKKTARNRNSHSFDLLSESDYKFEKMESNRIAACSVERQGVLGRVECSKRRRTAVYTCFAVTHDLADELPIAPERG